PVVQDWKCPVMHPANRAVRPLHSVLFIVIAADLFRIGGLRHTFAVLHMDRRKPDLRRSVYCLTGLSPHSFEATADIVNPRFSRVCHPEYFGNILRYLPE